MVTDRLRRGALGSDTVLLEVRVRRQADRDLQEAVGIIGAALVQVVARRADALPNRLPRGQPALFVQGVLTHGTQDDRVVLATIGDQVQGGHVVGNRREEEVATVRSCREGTEHGLSSRAPECAERPRSGVVVISLSARRLARLAGLSASPWSNSAYSW